MPVSCIYSLCVSYDIYKIIGNFCATNQPLDSDVTNYTIYSVCIPAVICI